MPQQQNADGSWSEAKPLDWAPGLDWEVYVPGEESGRWDAHLYEREKELAHVRAKSRFGLKLRMLVAQRGRKARVF